MVLRDRDPTEQELDEAIRYAESLTLQPVHLCDLAAGVKLLRKQCAELREIYRAHATELGGGGHMRWDSETSETWKDGVRKALAQADRPCAAKELVVLAAEIRGLERELAQARFDFDALDASAVHVVKLAQAKR